MSFNNQNEEQQKNALRSIKRRVEDNSKIIDDIVDTILAKYKRELDEFMDWVKTRLAQSDRLDDGELEAMTLRIPLLMYYASGGLETLGIEGDNAKAVRMELFNTLYTENEGTIPDKTKKAELGTMNEYLIEIAFTRAYKKLKVQLEMAEHVYSAAKKVFSKRILEYEMAMRDRGLVQPGRERYHNDR